MNALDFKIRSNSSIDQHLSSYETAAVAAQPAAVEAELSSYQVKMRFTVAAYRYDELLLSYQYYQPQSNVTFTVSAAELSYAPRFIFRVQSVAKKTGPPEKNGFLDFELLYFFYSVK